MQRFAEDIEMSSDEEQPLLSPAKTMAYPEDIAFQKPEEEEEPVGDRYSYSPASPEPEPEMAVSETQMPEAEEEDEDPHGLLSYSPVAPAQGVDEGIDEDV